MRGVFVFLFALILMIQPSFTQELYKKADLGEVIKFPDNHTLRKIISANNDGVFFFVEKQNQFTHQFTPYIFHFNNELKLVDKIEIELKTKFSKISLMEIIDFHEEMLLILGNVDVDNKIKYLYGMKVAYNDLKFDNELTTLSSDYYGDYSRYNSGRYTLVESGDTSKIAIMYTPPNDEDVTDKVGISVYDRNLNKLWSDNFVMPYDPELFKRGASGIQNNGIFIVSGKLYKDKLLGSVDGKPNYSYMVYTLSETGLRSFEIELGDHYVHNYIRYFIDENEVITAAGFYSELFKDGITGSFYFKIDLEYGKVLKQKFQRFSDEFLEKNTFYTENRIEKRTEKEKNVNIENLRYKGVIPYFYGSTYMILEYSTSEGYRGNLNLVELNSEGEMVDIFKIYKRSKVEKIRYSQSVLVEKQKRMMFLFNGDELDKENNPITGCPTLVQVDSNKVQTRELVLEFNETKLRFKPSKTFVINNEVYVVFESIFGKLQLGRITL